VLFLLSALGLVVVAAAPAGAAAPLTSAGVIVNPPSQASLLSLCITSQTLLPNGTCIDVPPATGGIAGSPSASGGTASATLFTGFQSIDFDFTGVITLGGRTFHGVAFGTAYPGGLTAAALVTDVAVPNFQLTGIDSTDTLTATCSGHWRSVDVSLEAGGAISQLACNGSVNGGPSGSVTLTSTYALTSASSGPIYSFEDYSGLFAGS
jgi:hypothetical protein